MEDKNWDFPLNCSTGHLGRKFDNPVGNLCWTVRNVYCSLSGKERNVSFFQRHIQTNCCFGRVKLNFTTLLKLLLPNCFNFFAESLKMFRKHSSCKKSPQFLLWTGQVESTFKIPGNWILRNPKIFRHIFSIFIPGFSSRTNFFPKDYCWRKDKLSKDPLKTSHDKMNFHHSIKENVENKFLVEIDFLKKFLWTRTLQFWESCRKHPLIIRISFLSLFQKGKTHRLGKSLPRRSSGDIENNFVRDAENKINARNFSPKVLFVFKNVSKWWLMELYKKYCFDKKFAKSRKKQFWWSWLTSLLDCIKVFSVFGNIGKTHFLEETNLSKFLSMRWKELSKTCQKKCQ